MSRTKSKQFKTSRPRFKLVNVDANREFGRQFAERITTGALAYVNGQYIIVTLTKEETSCV